MFSTKYPFGCDGMHSLVREQAAIPFIGGEYEEDFVLADVEMDWPLGREEINIFFSDEGLVVVAPLPENHFRIVATMKETPPEPSIMDFQKILEERGPENSGVSIGRMAWSSRWSREVTPR